MLLVQANRSTILSYFATFTKDVAVGYETAGGGSGFSPPMGLRVVWSYIQGQLRAIWVRLNWRQGDYIKHPHALAGSFYKKYLGYEHSQTCYRRIFLSLQ